MQHALRREGGRAQHGPAIGRGAGAAGGAADDASARGRRCTDAKGLAGRSAISTGRPQREGEKKNSRILGQDFVFELFFGNLYKVIQISFFVGGVFFWFLKLVS